jgi:hypothetical protein
VALAALTGLALSAAANAQSGSVRIQNSSGKYSQCTYSTLSVAPNGSVTVSCTSDITGDGGGTPPPPPPDPCTSTAATSFSLSSSGGTLASGASPSPALQVVRTGSCSGGYWVGYRVEGDGCAIVPTEGPGGIGYAKFTSGNGNPIDVPVAMNSTGTTCKVSLGVSGPISGTLNATYTKATSTPTPPPPGAPTPPAGCPALPSNAVYETFGPVSSHNKWMTKPNGTIIVAQMPSVSSSLSTVSMIFMPSPLVNTPGAGDVEYSISKCPGEIKTDYTDYCNVKHDISMYTQQWISRPTTQFPNRATANMYGYCWAPQSEGPYYLNARYVFPTACNYSAEFCGVIWQYY